MGARFSIEDVSGEHDVLLNQVRLRIEQMHAHEPEWMYYYAHTALREDGVVISREAWTGVCRSCGEPLYEMRDL